MAEDYPQPEEADRLAWVLPEPGERSNLMATTVVEALVSTGKLLHLYVAQRRFSRQIPDRLD